MVRDILRSWLVRPTHRFTDRETLDGVLLEDDMTDMEVAADGDDDDLALDEALPAEEVIELVYSIDKR
jgi:hypothetical protein